MYVQEESTFTPIAPSASRTRQTHNLLEVKNNVPQKPALVNPTAPEAPFGTLNCREFGNALDTGVGSRITVIPAPFTALQELRAAVVSFRIIRNVLRTRYGGVKTH